MTPERNVPYYQPKDFYQEDPFFQKMIRHYLPGDIQWAEKYLQDMGRLAAQEISPLVLVSDQNRPRLIPFDPTGKRIDTIDYHLSYRTIARLAYEFGIIGLGYSPQFKAKGWTYGPILKSAIGYLYSQAGSVLYCPICMTDGTLQVLKRHASEELKSTWIPRLTSMDYKTFADGGMYLTEIQGGSDVGANTCWAEHKNGEWRITGEKWFCSNIGSETALVLARPQGAPEGTAGLGLFLVPLHLENGERNKILVNRIKNKLGTCEMATGEVEFHAALAYPVGKIEKGFSYMTEMLNLSRTYNAIWSVGLMRRCFLEAKYYAEHRVAFGKPIIQYPLVAHTLHKMEQDAERAACLVFETLKYMEQVERGLAKPPDELMMRLLTPVIKFYTAEKCIEAAHRAIEIFGGNGCIEDFPVAKILRDSQILAIWEGTANILSLDLLRVMKKTKASEIFLKSTGEDLETWKGPKNKGDLQKEWGNLKNEFESVLTGADGFGGELACRNLAWHVAEFVGNLAWERIQLKNL